MESAWRSCSSVMALSRIKISPSRPPLVCWRLTASSNLDSAKPNFSSRIVPKSGRPECSSLISQYPIFDGSSLGIVHQVWQIWDKSPTLWSVREYSLPALTDKLMKAPSPSVGACLPHPVQEVMKDSQ